MKRNQLCRKGLHDDWIKTGSYYTCAPCRQVSNKAYRVRNRSLLISRKAGYWQKTGKNNALQKIYGITLDEYNALLKDQGGGCAICGRKPTGKALHVDHNHKNGDVRGLVCWGCNGMLGKLRDSAELAEKMAAYLRQEPYRKGSAVLGPSHKRKRRRKRK